jgi:predicted nucleic acid-binding OB-fold protein
MSGFQFVTDARGRKTAVLIDLKKHGRLWQDVYDAFLAESRKKGPFESHESVEKRLKARRTRG